MFNRIIRAAGIMVAAFVLAVPALAKRQVVYQKSGAGGVFATLGLLPTHRYQLQVSSSKGHVKFAGTASEFFTYTTNRNFRSGNKTVAISGTTPKTIMFNRPVKTTLQEWLLTVQVSTSSLGKVTLKYVDMGKHA